MCEGRRVLFITTCRNPDNAVLERARALAQRYQLSLESREIRGDALVVQRSSIVLRLDERYYPWHEGLIHALREAGARHPLVQLSGATRGAHVLDCTLGMGTDARFLSEVTQATVVGIEACPAIAILSEIHFETHGINIQVTRGDAGEVMRALPAKCMDIIIADPMFPPHLRKSSSSLDYLRLRACFQPLNEAWLAEALRIARYSIVVKDHKDNDLLERLNAPHIWSRGKRITRYGAWYPSGESPR